MAHERLVGDPVAGGRRASRLMAELGEYCQPCPRTESRQRGPQHIGHVVDAVARAAVSSRAGRL